MFTSKILIIDNHLTGVQTRSSSKRNRETVISDIDNGVKINWGEDDTEDKKDELRIKLAVKRHRRNALIPNGIEALAAKEV